MDGEDKDVLVQKDIQTGGRHIYKSGISEASGHPIYVVRIL